MRQHADDGVRSSIDDNGPADDRGICRETGAPQSIAENRHGIGCRLEVGGVEIPSEPRVQSDAVEEFAADAQAIHALGPIVQP